MLAARFSVCPPFDVTLNMEDIAGSPLFAATTAIVINSVATAVFAKENPIDSHPGEPMRREMMMASTIQLAALAITVAHANPAWR